jgi:hypothetical protein
MPRLGTIQNRQNNTRVWSGWSSSAVGGVRAACTQNPWHAFVVPTRVCICVINAALVELCRMFGNSVLLLHPDATGEHHRVDAESPQPALFFHAYCRTSITSDIRGRP